MQISNQAWHDYVDDVPGARVALDSAVLGFLNNDPDDRPSNFEDVFEDWSKFNQAISNGYGSNADQLFFVVFKSLKRFSKNGARLHKYWKDPVSFKGNRVFQRNDFFDPRFIDGLGRSNIQRMRKGLAPIGNDGKSINLHHLTQRENGGIAELTQTFHQQYSRVIHINSNKIPSGIDRGAFGRWRKSYWKNRANDFID